MANEQMPAMSKAAFAAHTQLENEMCSTSVKENMIKKGKEREESKPEKSDPFFDQIRPQHCSAKKGQSVVSKSEDE